MVLATEIAGTLGNIVLYATKYSFVGLNTEFKYMVLVCRLSRWAMEQEWRDQIQAPELLLLISSVSTLI